MSQRSPACVHLSYLSFTVLHFSSCYLKAYRALESINISRCLLLSYLTRLKLVIADEPSFARKALLVLGLPGQTTTLSWRKSWAKVKELLTLFEVQAAYVSLRLISISNTPPFNVTPNVFMWNSFLSQKMMIYGIVFLFAVLSEKALWHAYGDSSDYVFGGTFDLLWDDLWIFAWHKCEIV